MMWKATRGRNSAQRVEDDEGDTMHYAIIQSHNIPRKAWKCEQQSRNGLTFLTRFIIRYQPKAKSHTNSIQQTRFVQWTLTPRITRHTAGKTETRSEACIGCCNIMLVPSALIPAVLIYLSDTNKSARCTHYRLDRSISKVFQMLKYKVRYLESNKYLNKKIINERR